MSIEAAAGLVAEHLLKQDFVEVYGHHDADGIAAASILCHALLRAGKHFQLRIRPRISPEDLSRDGSNLLCDFGASINELPEDTMVIDHHIPSFDGEWHVNPCLEQIDGEHELSASGTAFLVAQEMGDNRDLVGIAMLGMIGDRQEFSGKNHEIVSEGIANNFISPHRGMQFCGRDLTEQLYTAINPYLGGISGEESVVEAIVEQCTITDGETNLDLLLSSLILETAPVSNADVMRSLYGNTYELERGVVHDAHTFAALVDACGQSGRGGLGATLCLRSPDGIDEAWEVARQHRLRVIDGIKSAKRTDETLPFYVVEDPSVASGVADALAYDGLLDTPVFTIANRGDNYSVSARCPAGVDMDLASLMSGIAGECGGTGGGHRTRAGAMIKADSLECFNKGLAEAIA